MGGKEKEKNIKENLEYLPIGVTRKTPLLPPFNHYLHQMTDAYHFSSLRLLGSKTVQDR